MRCDHIVLSAIAALLACSCVDAPVDTVADAADMTFRPLDSMPLDTLVPDRFVLDAAPPLDARLTDGKAPSDMAIEADAALDMTSEDDAFVPDAMPDATPPAPDVGMACVDPPGSACDPIVVDTFPSTLMGDTTRAPAAAIDAYSCAPDTDESGGEIWYRLDLPSDGLLTARVDDMPGDAIDVDIHLLGAPAPDACVARDNIAIAQRVTAGSWWLVIDTWVTGAGVPRPGPYTLDLAFRPAGEGDCAFDPQPLRMVWRSCDPSLDCVEQNGQVFLETPALGPVVKEAHLVTVGDDFGGGWPDAARDGLEAHYALSEMVTGYAMDRREAWAPEGEGGSEWGQAAFFRPLPIEDEAWYVNMYWRDRPAPGTRMLVTNPANGRTVVAAGGYETGPGSNTAVGGVTEEIHHYLGTTHRDPLMIGFALDPDLPLGPIDCAP